MSATTPTRRRGNLLTLTLALLVIASGVAVVEVKQHARDLTSRLEQLHHRADALDREQAQLQLEDATLSSHGRIEELAQKQGMVEPGHYVIVEGDR